MPASGEGDQGIILNSGIAVKLFVSGGAAALYSNRGKVKPDFLPTRRISYPPEKLLPLREYFRWCENPYQNRVFSHFLLVTWQWRPGGMLVGFLVRELL